MSEFYKLRRSKISDAMALLGFIAGFIIPAYKAGQRLVEGFQNPGFETQGLTAFVITILGNALAGGAAGLVAGIVVGWIWERVHKLLRSARSRRDAFGQGILSPNTGTRDRNTAGTPTPTPSTFASRPGGHFAGAQQAGPDDIGVPSAAIRFDNSGIAVGDFLSLTQQVIPGDYDEARVSSALQKTINIGAWDGDRLVGAVRVLSDGYLYSTIPEIIVDAAYRRRGIGRELMSRALDVSATGVVLFGSPPESAGFFERLGCQRATSGFVLRRKVAASVRVR